MTKRNGMVSFGAWLASIAVSLLTSTSRADIPNVRVWFEATGNNSVSGFAQQGAPGSDLALICDTSMGPVGCEWTISMKVQWDTGASVSVIGSMGTDFLGNTAKHALTDMTIGDYPLDGHQIEEINAGGVLAATRLIQIPVTAQSEFEVIPPGEYTALVGNLATTKQQGSLTQDAIDIRINSLLWTLVYQAGAGPDAIVQFGNAEPVNGAGNGTVVEDVITIQNVPEPATGVFVATAAIAGIVRSRRADRREIRQ